MNTQQSARDLLLDVISVTECANNGRTPEGLLDAYRKEELAKEAARQRAAADILPEHLAAVRPLIDTVADLIDPDALVWFAPARIRDAATDLLARVRDLQAEVERLSSDRAEVRSAIALDLVELHDDPATPERNRAGLRAAARRIPIAQDGGY
jgi:hypothetical protein